MADGVASFIDRTAPIKSSLLELQKQPPISIQSTSDEARKRTFQLHLLRTKRLNFHTGLRHSFVSAKREPKPQTKRNKKMATAEIDSSSSTSGSSAVVAAVNAPAPFFFGPSITFGLFFIESSNANTSRLLVTKPKTRRGGSISSIDSSASFYRRVFLFVFRADGAAGRFPAPFVLFCFVFCVFFFVSSRSTA